MEEKAIMTLSNRARIRRLVRWRRVHAEKDEVYFARRLDHRTPLQGEGEFWLLHKPLAKQSGKA
jgi:hypothetical protein